MAGSVEEVINTLYEMVQDAWSLPLGADKCVLERDKVLDLLDEMNNQLPNEFKQAKTIVDARNEIINGAKREADSIVKQAEIKAKQLVSDTQIQHQAEAEADRIIADANAQAAKVIENANRRLQDLKDASIRFVVDALTETESAIHNSLSDVSATKERLNNMLSAQGKTMPKTERPERQSEENKIQEEQTTADNKAEETDEKTAEA